MIIMIWLLATVQILHHRSNLKTSSLFHQHLFCEIL
uniref:Uncharacterized protein n=1 Tax=Amphimedon queenslandica TaxID=400682 RepID=A0A1X7T3V2_AMPQE